MHVNGTPNLVDSEASEPLSHGTCKNVEQDYDEDYTQWVGSKYLIHSMVMVIEPWKK